MVPVLLFFTLLAAAAAVAVRLAPELLRQSSQIDTLRANIEQARTDVSESAKKVETLGTSLKAVRQELGRAKEAIVDLDRELEKRGKVDPVLIFSIAKSGYAPEVRSYRAPLTKTVPAGAEPHQSQIWRRTCFVEVRAFSRAQVVVEAELQFPARGGYKVGAFVQVDEPGAAESAA